MSYAKIATHRNIFHGYPTSKLDGAGSSYDLTSLSDGQELVVSGAYVTGLVPTCGKLYFAHAELPAAATLIGDTSLTAPIWQKLTGSKVVLGSESSNFSSSQYGLCFSGSVLNNRNKFLAIANITFSGSEHNSLLDFAFATSNVVNSSSIMSTLNLVTGSIGGSAVTGECKNVNINTIISLTASQVVELWARTNVDCVLSHPSASISLVQI
jgi:hypothetical protein